MWVWALMALGALLALVGYGLGRAAAQTPPGPPERPQEPDAPVQYRPPEPTLWAAYGGHWAGAEYRPTFVALFATEIEAGRYAAHRGLFVTAVNLGRPLSIELARAALAPVVPWDEPP